MRHDRAHKFRQRDHAAFDMEMPVDQTWRQICAGKIDNLLRVIIAEANHAPVIDRDVGVVNFAAQHVDELRILEEQLGRLFAARDAQFVLQLSHERTCSAVACSGVVPSLPSAADDTSRDRVRDRFCKWNGGRPAAYAAGFAESGDRIANRFAHGERKHERRFANRFAAVNDVGLRRLRKKRDVENFRRIADRRNFVSVGRMREQSPLRIPNQFFRCKPSRALNESAFDLTAGDSAIHRIAGVVQNIDALDLHHPGEAIDLDFADRRADREIMKRFSLAGLAIEMNVRRFVKTGRAQTRAREISALNHFRHRHT